MTGVYCVLTIISFIVLFFVMDSAGSLLKSRGESMDKNVDKNVEDAVFGAVVISFLVFYTLGVWSGSACRWEYGYEQAVKECSKLGVKEVIKFNRIRDSSFLKGVE